MANKRKCKCGCGADISHKHLNAKFFNQKHKDTYHNRANPRGKFAHLHPDNQDDDHDPGDDMYWLNKDYD